MDGADFNYFCDHKTFPPKKDETPVPATEAAEPPAEEPESAPEETAETAE